MIFRAVGVAIGFAVMCGLGQADVPENLLRQVGPVGSLHRYNDKLDTRYPLLYRERNSNRVPENLVLGAHFVQSLFAGLVELFRQSKMFRDHNDSGLTIRVAMVVESIIQAKDIAVREYFAVRLPKHAMIPEGIASWKHLSHFWESMTTFQHYVENWWKGTLNGHLGQAVKLFSHDYSGRHVELLAPCPATAPTNSRP